MITGFHDADDVYTETGANIGFVTGNIFTAPPAPGTIEQQVIAEQALADARIAHAELRALPGGQDPGNGTELSGLTLAPGVYSTAATFLISGGTLTLDAGGDPNAFWVFQSTALTVGNGVTPGSVSLINGAQSKNVYWALASAATINGITGGGVMEGTILAPAGVTFSTAGQVNTVTLNGRAVGLDASVTLVNTIINIPAP